MNPSYRLQNCGSFPNYELNGVSFSGKSFAYLVSVGGFKFEKKWLERIVDFTEKVGLKKLYIIVADSLQRFNIKLDQDLNEESALKVSIENGKKWVEENKKYFYKLPEANYEFIHWEELKKNEHFTKYFNVVEEWSKNDNSFIKALDESIEEYISRRKKLKKNEHFTEYFNVVEEWSKNDNSFIKALDKSIEGSITRNENGLDPGQRVLQSKKFLKEESAVIRVLARDENIVALFYPGPPLPIFKWLVEYFNKHDREKDNLFFYKELIPTLGKKRNKPNIQKYLRNLPFFRVSNEDADIVPPSNKKILSTDYSS